jgi:hypothetical protein
MSEFADDDFEEEYPEEEAEEEVEPKKTVAKVAPRRPVAAQAPVAQKRNAPAPQRAAAKDTEAPTARYAFFALPQRVGVFDNVEGKPIFETSDAGELNTALLMEMYNDIKELKQSL